MESEEDPRAGSEPAKGGLSGRGTGGDKPGAGDDGATEQVNLDEIERKRKAIADGATAQIDLEEVARMRRARDEGATEQINLDEIKRPDSGAEKQPDRGPEKRPGIGPESPAKRSSSRPAGSGIGQRRSSDAPEPAKPTKSPPRGGMQFQDPATTKPRPPTPAEVRAKQKYEDQQRELEEARLAAEAKKQKQKRILMGSAAAVGVVGLVAGVGYWLLSPSNVTAQCVQEDPSGQPVIVPDSYCTGHTPGMNGFFFWGGHQYRYYYGSSGSIGQRPIGGSTTIPPGAHVTTKSGTTVQRGGIGGSGGKGGSGGS